MKLTYNIEIYNFLNWNWYILLLHPTDLITEDMMSWYKLQHALYAAHFYLKLKQDLGKKSSYVWSRFRIPPASWDNSNLLLIRPWQVLILCYKWHGISTRNLETGESIGRFICDKWMCVIMNTLMIFHLWNVINVSNS